MKIYREVKGLPEEEDSEDKKDGEVDEEKSSFDVVIGGETETVENKEETTEGQNTEE